MNYSIIPVARFMKEVKRLAKKYPSIKSDLAELNLLLQNNPESGVSLGNSLYKIRLAITSKGKGKSGGARVVTYVVTENSEVYLLTIYDKSELDSIDDKTLQAIVDSISH